MIFSDLTRQQFGDPAIEGPAGQHDICPGTTGGFEQILADMGRKADDREVRIGCSGLLDSGDGIGGQQVHDEAGRPGDIGLRMGHGTHRDGEIFRGSADACRPHEIACEIENHHDLRA